MNERLTEPLDDYRDDASVWPPAVTAPAIVLQPRPETLLELIFSRFVGFSLTLVSLPVWCLLLPNRTRHPGVIPCNDFRNYLTDPAQYRVGLGIVIAMATVGIGWSLWDTSRSWKRLKKLGKIAGSAKFVLSCVAILINGCYVYEYYSIWTRQIK